MSKLNVGPVNEKNERDGHALASALAADGASVSDIAEATHTSYLDAAWMLAAQLPPHRLVAFTSQIRADQRHYYRSGAARLLRVIAADKVRTLTRRRAVRCRLYPPDRHEALARLHETSLLVGREHGPQGCPGRSVCNRNWRAPGAACAGDTPAVGDA
jgi:hypothetical protein